jgi:hypothetical protein
MSATAAAFAAAAAALLTIMHCLQHQQLAIQQWC